MLRGQCVGKMEPSKERLSVFLENVRQEMPKAHLELLHSGSLCVTAEAISAPPAHLLLGCFVLDFHCRSRREELLCECVQDFIGVSDKVFVTKCCG